MSIFKSFIAWFAVCAIVFLAAAGNVKAETSDEFEAAPKFEICLLATQHAMDGYRLKEAKKKIRYTQVDDVVIALILKQATNIGYYKSTSVDDAATQAFEACVENKVWN